MNRLIDLFDSKGLIDGDTKVTLHDSVLDGFVPTGIWSL